MVYLLTMTGQKAVMNTWTVCDLCSNFVKEVSSVDNKNICQPCAKMWVYLDKAGHPHLRKRVWNKCSIE
jgi:hypothetical protein